MSDYLPEALVLEILYRLPPTAVVKCTSVCKAWNTIIKSHSFISSHLQRSLSNPNPNPNPPLLMRHCSPFSTKQRYSLCSPATPFRRISELECSISIRPQFFFRFVGTINGIVCLSNDFLEYTGVNAIILWNPLIKKHVELPKSLFTSYVLGPHRYGLGFGFDSKNIDYKVVRVFYRQRSNDIGNDMVSPLVELYSLNEGAWRIIDGSYLKLRVDESSMEQCYLHGKVHWVAYDMRQQQQQQSLFPLGEVGYMDQTTPLTQKNLFRYNCVLIFNVEEEEFMQMGLPEELSTILSSKLTISVVEGCLSVMEYPSFGLCNIWMSREYGVVESWSKMYIVNLQQGIGKVMGLRTSSELLVVPHPMFHGGPVDVHSFDSKSQKLRRLFIVVTVAGFYASDYTGSLVLLDRVSDAISCRVHELHGESEVADSDLIDSKKRKRN